MAFFLRQPSRPNPASPVANSGRAAGNGVVALNVATGSVTAPGRDSAKTPGPVVMNMRGVGGLQELIFDDRQNSPTTVVPKLNTVPPSEAPKLKSIAVGVAVRSVPVTFNPSESDGVRTTGGFAPMFKLKLKPVILGDMLLVDTSVQLVQLV